MCEEKKKEMINSDQSQRKSGIKTQFKKKNRIKF